MIIENPTWEQRITLAGIVYLIQNKINKKSYIGESHLEFNFRYSGGKWWIYSHNKNLKNSVEKYGLNNFKLSILEYGIKTKKERLKIQAKYIHEYNSLYPNGYNFIIENENDCIETVHVKKYVLLDKDEKECVFYNVEDFARKNNINGGNVHSVLNGKHFQTNGFHRPGTILKKQWHKKPIKFIDNLGKIYEIWSLRCFAREHNLCFATVRNIATGKTQSCHGFRLLNINEKFIPETNKGTKTYYDIILEKDGILYKYNKVKNFCDEQNIGAGSLYNIIYGIRKTAKGFKLVSFKTLDK